MQQVKTDKDMHDTNWSQGSQRIPNSHEQHQTDAQAQLDTPKTKTNQEISNILVEHPSTCRAHAQPVVRWKSVSWTDHHVRGRPPDIAGKLI